MRHPESFGWGLPDQTSWAAAGDVVSNSTVLLKTKEVGVGALGEKKPWERFARKRQHVNFSSWMRLGFFCANASNIQSCLFVTSVSDLNLQTVMPSRSLKPAWGFQALFITKSCSEDLAKRSRLGSGCDNWSGEQLYVEFTNGIE